MIFPIRDLMTIFFCQVLLMKRLIPIILYNPHLVQEHLSNNVIVTTNMATPIHNGQMCK